MAKKGSFADLLYLALIVSVLRTNSNQIDDNVFNEQFGGSAVDELGPTSAVNIYLHNLRNSYSFDANIYTNSAKTNVLYEETLDILREVNSLGRYSRDNRFESPSVFAYLVSGGEAQRPEEPLRAAIASTSSSSLSSSVNTTQTHELETESSNESSNDSITSDVSQRSSPTPTPPQPHEDETTTSLTFDFSELGVNDSLVEEVLKSDCIYGDSDREDDGFVENNLLNDFDDALINTGSPEPLVSSDQMLPILHSIDDDVDSLFDELERLLAPEETDILQSINTANTDPFTDGWQASNSNLYQSNVSSLLPIDSQDIHPSLYYESNPSATNLNGDNRTNSSLEANNANAYELGNTYNHSLVVPSNIGAALMSSMATLTNSSEPMPEMGCSAAIYGPEMNDYIYVNNGNSSQVFNQNNSEYSLQDFLSDEDLHLIEMSTASNQTIPHYHMPSHHYIQNHNQTDVHNTTEDIIDASSDSAVSSMSSDRIHSLSDNEWIDSCSETSSQHGDPNHNDYTSRLAPNGYRLANNSAQKKYKLFGRRNEIKEEINYDSQRLDSNQLSNNSSTFSDGYTNGMSDSYCYTDLSQQTTQNHNLVANAPSVSSVSHNHTYHIPNPPNTEMNSAVNSLSAVDAMNAIHQQWISAKINTNSRRKYSTDSENLTEEQQMNRDEKRAKALRIPIPTFEIINLPIDEFNERLAKYDLNESQLSLIRDIRRRGKNKVAAQNCRKRKLDQILGLQHEVDSMFSQKHLLESQHDELLILRQIAREKYTKLYHFIVEASGAQQTYDSDNCPPDYPHRPLEQQLESDRHNNSFIVNANCSESEVRVNSLTEMQMNFQNEKLDKNE